MYVCTGLWIYRNTHSSILQVIAYKVICSAININKFHPSLYSVNMYKQEHTVGTKCLCLKLQFSISTEIISKETAMVKEIVHTKI